MIKSVERKPDQTVHNVTNRDIMMA